MPRELSQGKRVVTMAWPPRQQRTLDRREEHRYIRASFPSGVSRNAAGKFANENAKTSTSPSPTEPW